MIFEIIPVGPFQCNCIILGCEETGLAVVIDPGEEADRIMLRLNKHQLKPVYLLHTHAHIDHIGATDTVRTKTGACVALHEDDLSLCQNLGLQADHFGLPAPPIPVIDHFFKKEESLSFGKKTANVFHTPGHTPGSVTFYIPTVGLMTGDTLFKGSIGRTDLWGGSHRTIMESITAMLDNFPDEMVVYPGHGPATTVGREKRENPFIVGR